MMRATPETAFSPPLRESDSHAGLSPNLAIKRIPPEKTSSSSSSSSQASPSVSLLKMKPNSSLILAKAAMKTVFFSASTLLMKPTIEFLSFSSSLCLTERLL